eukprot:gb/GEZN01005640.1/.p1 GENE.gb/GEZN01005640.1/~~gb/GEZN01005640.1/.p1  ORF type:complete len:453 (-),score=48.41 gb/GEZN01005640.1/:251-1609(-)
MPPPGDCVIDVTKKTGLHFAKPAPPTRSATSSPQRSRSASVSMSAPSSVGSQTRTLATRKYSNREDDEDEDFYHRSSSPTALSRSSSTSSMGSTASSSSSTTRSQYSNLSISTRSGLSRALTPSSVSSPNAGGWYDPSPRGSTSSLTSLPRGVVVTTVKPGSLCADAGLRQGDIITHVNDRRVYDTDDMAKFADDFRTFTVRRPESKEEPGKFFTVNTKTSAHSETPLRPMREESPTEECNSKDTIPAEPASPPPSDKCKNTPSSSKGSSFSARLSWRNALSNLSNRKSTPLSPQPATPPNPKGVASPDIPTVAEGSAALKPRSEAKGPLAADSPLSPSRPSPLLTMEARLLHFFKKHSPRELAPGFIEQVCQAYANDEDTLWKNLGELHGQDKVMPYKIYQKAAAVAAATAAADAAKRKEKLEKVSQNAKAAVSATASATDPSMRQKRNAS